MRTHFHVSLWGSINSYPQRFYVASTVIADRDEAKRVACEANAAPGLLAALERGVNLTLDESDPACRAFLEQARVAIAKAKG